MLAFFPQVQETRAQHRDIFRVASSTNLSPMPFKQVDAVKDFFISYTSADRHWAEWIAWQLEANDYSSERDSAGGR